jgi:adenine phosphoribosyltransferase
MNKKELKNNLITIMSSESDYLIPNHNEVYQKVISELIKPIKNLNATKISAIDMKGLMYGPIVANKLKLPFVPILKGNKIKSRKLITKGELFVDYSKLKKSLEMFKSSISKGDRVILIDDWFDSGKTGKSAIKLIEKLGGKVIGISVIFNQLKPKDKAFFDRYNYHFLVKLQPKS